MVVWRPVGMLPVVLLKSVYRKFHLFPTDTYFTDKYPLNNRSIIVLRVTVFTVSRSDCVIDWDISS
jgi:hypothetical protein